MRDKTKKIIIWVIIIVLVATVAILGLNLYKKYNETRLASENMYNQALYEMVDYLENVENYLAKAQISTSAKHGAETLTSLWREANLAQTYLSMLPVDADELEKTSKLWGEK